MASTPGSGGLIAYEARKPSTWKIRYAAKRNVDVAAEYLFAIINGQDRPSEVPTCEGVCAKLFIGPAKENKGEKRAFTDLAQEDDAVLTRVVLPDGVLALCGARDFAGLLELLGQDEEAVGRAQTKPDNPVVHKLLLFPEIELDGPVLPGTWDSVYGVIAEDSPEAHAKLLPHLKALQTSTWEQLCEKFGNLKSSS
mmetsp:Transcript_45966/g.103827  ORF Transcript_45966/g.103827 Transcript_45966/m.103827 type:complete len:196 (-) Transcript_45966:897-1484(-)